MTQVVTIGLDLAKNVFQADGADAAGAVVFPHQRAALNHASADLGIPFAHTTYIRSCGQI